MLDHPRSFDPPVTFPNLLSTFDRATIASAVEVLVAVLDAMDGDPDLEEDDPSGQCDEDEFNTALHMAGFTVGANAAGCPLADGGGEQY